MGEPFHKFSIVGTHMIESSQFNEIFGMMPFYNGFYVFHIHLETILMKYVPKKQNLCQTKVTFDILENKA